MIREAIIKIVDKQDLTYDEAYQVMNEIMSGQTSPTQNAAFLAALSTKSTKAETVDEIAGRLGVPRGQVAAAMEAIVEPLSLYEPVYSENGDSLYVIDQLSDSSRDASDESWLENIALREAVATLNPREQTIIRLRFYQDKTQMEIASEIGISQAQVSRLEKAALEKLRRQL